MKIQGQFKLQISLMYFLNKKVPRCKAIQKTEKGKALKAKNLVRTYEFNSNLKNN